MVVQFGRYQESSRDLFGLSSKYAPLQSDSLQASAWAAFTDRLKGTVNFRQDTWSGATPIATRHLLHQEAPIFEQGSPGRSGASLPKLDVPSYDILRAFDLMHQGDELPLVLSGASLKDALLEMTQKGLGMTAVVDAKNRLQGVYTDGDLRRHMAPDVLTRAASEIMTRDPRTIGPRALAVEGVAAMNGPPRPVNVLFVLDGAGHPVGALHLHDCLKAGIA